MAGTRWMLALAGLWAAAPAAAQQRTVTLAEAIEQAERVQPRMVSAEGAVRSTGARLLTARGAYLPNLNLNASGSTFFSESQRIDPSTGQLVTGGTRTRSLSSSLSSSVELFDGFRRSNDLGAARANDVAAEASLVDARFQQALQTTNTFFDALAANQLVRVREASLRRAEQQLSTSIARLQAGAATRSDSLRSLVTVGNAELALVNIQASVATAEANLGRLIGETARVAAADDSAFYRMVGSLDTVAIRTEALSRSPTVQAADASARAADAALKASRSTYWPSLVLSGSYSLNATDRNDYTFYNNRRLSIALSWPLFNRFQREEQVAQRAATRDAERARAADARREVEAALTAQFAALDAATQRIALTALSVEAARAEVQVAFERYRLGSITITELTASQSGLIRAEEAAVAARFEFLRARAEIEAILGRPL